MNVTQPIATTPIGSVVISGKRFDVSTNPEFVRFFAGLFDRVGGSLGPSTPDLAVAQFDDAGIQEIQSVLYETADQAAQADPAGDLREQLEALRIRVQALEAGVSL